MRDLAESLELACTAPDINVSEHEYIRLLGYPRNWVLEGRAQELAVWARQWYAANGKPWLYARQVQNFEIAGEAILIDGVSFTSKRLQATLQQAEAHTVILAAVGAGPEAEEEARRRWEDQKPDEYFFLEMFASAVVEHLATVLGARLCDWAEHHGMAVLPHYSPGYSEWDIAEQPRLLNLIKQTRRENLPSSLEVFDTGMLRPKKTLLAVFGVTRRVEHIRRLAGLIPCENCSFGPCQYRRAPYRRAPVAFGEQVTVSRPALDPNAEYSTNRKALKRWANERLSLRENQDGSFDALFRYEGTTCTNMGLPLSFDYNVNLGTRDKGYPIHEQRCSPAAGDSGHTRMCQFIENPERLMKAIGEEHPLNGEHLDAVLSWRRKISAAGCYCDASSREHKWGLVLETIHYALVQRELAEDKESS